LSDSIENRQEAGFARTLAETNHVNDPVRLHQLPIFINLINNLSNDKRALLNLGVGPGQIDAAILQYNKSIHLTGVDFSQPMLDLAQETLAVFGERVKLLHHDLSTISELDFKPESFDLIYTSQVLHELPNDIKLAVLRYVRQILSPGGHFLWMDRMSMGLNGFHDAHKSVRDTLQFEVAEDKRQTFENYISSQAVKSDYTASLTQHFALLNKAGFDAECVHLHGDRAIFVAV
jgi:tRNA (cmo5U34)-methyltransferase